MNSMIRGQLPWAWAIAVVTITVAASNAWGASPNPTVTVVNTTANPVPVSGNITIGNSVVPVEVSNADPIPVSVQQSPAPVRGRWSDSTTGKSPVIFTVPAGTRRIVTDVVVSTQFSTATNRPPNVVLLSECGANDTKEVLSVWTMVQNYDRVFFSSSEHFATGIVLNAGECFKVAAGEENEVTVLWYDENAN